MHKLKIKALELKLEFEKIARNVTRWANDKLPPVVRSILGVLFFIGGCFGFLPILGFWMIPVGIMLVMLDLPFTRHRVVKWIESEKN